MENFTLTQITDNYAEARGLTLYVRSILNEKINFFEEQLWIYNGEDAQPLVIYSFTPDQTFNFISNGQLAEAVKEELPAWIKNEKHLRQVLDFIPKSL